MRRNFSKWKIVMLLVMFFSISASSFSQEVKSKVEFRDLTWEQAMRVAAKEKKFIFVDAYMDPCQSCDDAMNGVLSVDSIAGLYNENFVSIRIDMRTEAGLAFAPKLQMLMYPAYIFFSADGEQLGSTNAWSFVKDPAKSYEAASAAIANGLSRLKNTRSIVFEEGFDWAAILEKSKSENKPIFIDAYTTWCRPCIQMDRNVFTLDTVADYYNEHFINVKMNAEKEEGVDIAKKFEVRAYPTYLYLDTDGKLIRTESGYTEADKFIGYGKEAYGKFAEGNGIVFEELDWAGVKAKAKAENKLIFFDAYTTWCGPCKQMSKNVFTDSTLAAFFNEKFINAKFDMEKGEGITLKDEFNVRAYPTYVFLDAEGSPVHRTVGSTTIEQFLEYAKDALSPDKNLAYLTAKYEGGDRSFDVVQDYLKALKVAYMSDEMNTVAVEYLDDLKPKKLLEEENWTLIKEYLKNPSSSSFQYLVNNREKFYKDFDKKEINDKIYNVYVSSSWNYITYDDDNNRDFDAAGFEAYLKEIEDSGFDRKDELIAYGNINVLFALQKWEEYAEEIDKALDGEIIKKTPLTLYNYALTMKRYAETPELLSKGANWAFQGGEAESNEQYKVTYFNLQAELLEKAGKTEEAEAARAHGAEYGKKDEKPKNAMIELIKQ